MENLVPLYRLKQGKLISEDKLEIPFYFGLVYEDEGLFYFELFFDEKLQLEKIYDENTDVFNKEYLKLESITEDNHILKSTKICFKSLPFHKNKGDFHCFGSVYIERHSNNLGLPANNEIDNLFFLHLEGLNMEFNSRTDVKKWRDNEEVGFLDDRGDFSHDHTICIIKIGWNEYKTIWKKNNQDELFVQIKSDKSQYLPLKFEDYRKFKSDFIEFLSFFNGAKVQIRAEYTGQYSIHPNFDSHKKYIYSYKKEKAKRFNSFIPLNNPWFRNNNILDRAFRYNFENYIKVNEKLDLNTIVFYLNNAEQANSMGERIFIQTILLERFSKAYMKLLESVPRTLIDAKIFDSIKNDFNKVLENNKPLLGKDFDTFKSRLLNINQLKNTEKKFELLIKGAGLNITPEIEKLLIDRNEIVHEGEIGEGPKAENTYHLLDLLIRRIIINFIKYNGPTSENNVGDNIPPPFFDNDFEFNPS
jgi:hypothetical protein